MLESGTERNKTHWLLTWALESVANAVSAAADCDAYARKSNNNASQQMHSVQCEAKRNAVRAFTGWQLLFYDDTWRGGSTQPDRQWGRETESQAGRQAGRTNRQTDRRQVRQLSPCSCRLPLAAKFAQKLLFEFCLRIRHADFSLHRPSPCVCHSDKQQQNDKLVVHPILQNVKKAHNMRLYLPKVRGNRFAKLSTWK